MHCSAKFIVLVYKKKKKKKKKGKKAKGIPAPNIVPAFYPIEVAPTLKERNICGKYHGADVAVLLIDFFSLAKCSYVLLQHKILSSYLYTSKKSRTLSVSMFQS